ncbi:MAG TPA: disulfide bond formation protein B [Methylophilaceae bacterium]|nr:disulfide bond formation protein B [Methylophilaceae bacterium]HQR60220.1 disulfide bond formation protein B [Methylophilaceae bacterium]
MLGKLLHGRTPYFLGAAASFGLVGLAIFLQLRNNLDPCPLCISQRIAFMALGTAFLLAALHNPAGLWRKLHGLLQLAAAATGAAIAARHIWVQAHPGQTMSECGVGFDYMIHQFPMSKAVRLIFQGTGECSVIDWTLFGITIPQLSLIAFTGLGVYAIVLAFAKGR